ncbi:hypothetical protein LC555_02190 [Fusobacterium animalis]|mgnify:CR=1 FL=1|nr:hypothetical protein [Fusobacterium nucleatum]EGN65554.1 hypothetical protein HMPREF0404_00472 [Fusobacterium animalis 21_1A]ERT35777.1 hypothetical protein HMPREF1540_01081 [Fusobacterium nucleatum CTI-3]
MEMNDISEIKRILDENFSSYYNTLKIVSKRDDGKNSGSMIDDSEFKIFNYDRGILTKLIPKENVLCTVDGIDIKHKKIFFIEFKDGKIFGRGFQTERKLIRLKVLESLIEFVKLPLNMSFTEICLLEKIFILVYNEEAHFKIQDFKYERKKKLKEQIQDFLAQLQKYQKVEIYTDIHIYEKKEFIKKYILK